MKKGCFLLGALLALSSCADGADRKFEHVQTVVNNSSVAVSFRNDQNSDILNVGAGETKEVGFYSGNALPVLTLDDASYPRVSVSSRYRDPKVFEKVYTVSDCAAVSVTFKNLSGKDVVVFGNYLGSSYSKDGIEISANGEKTEAAYKSESYKAQIKGERIILTVSQAEDADGKAIKDVYIVR